MSTRASGIILYVTLIGGILSLTGEGGPDRDIVGGKGLPQSQEILSDMSAPAGSPGEARIRQNLSYGNIPLYFVPNKGQVNEAARFYARASRYTLWLTAEGLVFDRSVGKERADGGNRQSLQKEAEGLGVRMPGESPRAELKHPEGRKRDSRGPVESGSESRNVGALRQEEQRAGSKREVHRLIFMGANPEPKIEGEGGTGQIANYFIGSDPAKWRTNIATSRAAVYKELYPDIDLKVYGVEKQIEYDWLVKPGGDPGAIDFAYRDVLRTKIDADGDLIVRTELGEFRHRKPVAYQETTDGIRESVEARFRNIGPDRYGFTVGDYDPSHPLIIDPVVLIYSSFLGGSSSDFGYGIAVDGNGCAYITGLAFSNDFPSRYPYQSQIHGDGDAFITKFSTLGNELIYSTYIGGTRGDEGLGIAVDNAGCAYITGYTSSPDYPVRNPFQANLGLGNTCFVTKLTAAGTDLAFSTYLGGGIGRGIAVDSSGCAYVTGETFSSNFPLRNPIQWQLRGAYDSFVTKFSASGNDLAYSTYLGGSDSDYGFGIAVDSARCAYITGETWSLDFPTRNPFQPSNMGEVDCFVVKLVSAGNDLAYSTLLGGTRGDMGRGISVDSFGCAYATGWTFSADFPIQRPFQAILNGPYDCFVTKLAAEGSGLEYSTYLGGSTGDYGAGISVDGSGSAFVTGWTYGPEFPLRNPFQERIYGKECFVSRFTAAGNDLIYSTYLGGESDDSGNGIAVDSSGSVIVVGETYSEDFPTQNPFQANLGGAFDAFVTKLGMGYTVTASVSGAGGAVSPATQTVVAGQSATINFYPDTGYTIASITDNGGSVGVANPYIINNVREDHDVVVTFDHVYTVTASVNGVGGSVSPATQTVTAGGTATIQIYPDLGYHIGSIRDNGVLVAIASPYIIDNVQEDHSVVVTFANAPPTIRIVSPTNGAKVYGVVTVKAEASDDLRVLKVAFLIDDQMIGEDAFVESMNLYTQAWDTRGYTFGTHRVKAVAYDEAGLTAEDAINVVVENVALTLQGQRLTEGAWILKKPFIQLTISIQNLGQVSVAEYVIYRKNGAGDFKAIKEIPGSEVSGPTYVWVDKTINKNQTYTYRVLALSSGGVALGVSNDITL